MPLDTSKPLVSVIIPTYNRVKTVCEAIDSVLNQTYGNIEVIVVDDGSTDGTGDVLKSRYGDAIQYIYQENQGTPPRNVGIRQSKGEYIAFLDSDDLWKPNKLDIQIEQFKNLDEDVGLTYSGFEYSSQDGGTEQTHGCFYKGEVVDDLVVKNFIQISSVVMRRKCFELTGFFDETLLRSEDWDLWLRLVFYYEVACIDEVLISKRQVDSNMMKDIKRIEGIIHVLDKFFAHPRCPKRLIQNKSKIYAQRYASFVAKCYYANAIPEMYSYLFKAISTNPFAIKPYHVRMALTAHLRKLVYGNK